MPLFTDEISFAGDFFMPEINLLGQADPLNLRSVFLELNIYESIYKPMLYGNFGTYVANNLHNSCRFCLSHQHQNHQESWR